MKQTTQICALILLLIYSSCNPFKKIYDLPNEGDRKKRPNILAVFMDGTNNGPNKCAVKRTNIFALSKMVKPEVSSYYIEGVGTNFKVLGLGLGLGVSKRVRYSYEYIASKSKYKPGDSICLFGFSRGAYSCRILSDFIYVAGIPDLSKIPDSLKKKVIRKMYVKYRGQQGLEGRKYNVAQFINKWNKRYPQYEIIERHEPVKIELMGLYDTVEAMAAPDYSEDDFGYATRNHLNQIANVKQVFHAVALDDNRARIFTPILLTSEDVKHNSNDINTSAIVEEVWFSGCHLDVGGGQKKNPAIRNTSLKWMLSVTKPYHLFENGPDLIEDRSSEVKDMQKNIFWKALYKKQNRNISRYYTANKNIYPQLKVHESVIERMGKGVVPDFKLFKRDTLDWFDKPPFDNCFNKDPKDKNIRHFKGCECIEVVRNND